MRLERPACWHRFCTVTGHFQAALEDSSVWTIIRLTTDLVTCPWSFAYGRINTVVNNNNNNNVAEPMTPLNAKLAFFSLTWKSTVTQWGSCKHKSVIGLISKLLLLTNGQLGRALILVSLALYLQSTSVSLVLLMLRILNSFLLHFLHYLLVSWAWRDWLWPGWLAIVRHFYDTVGWVIWLVKSSPKWPVMCWVWL